MIPIAKPVFGEEELNAVKEVLASGFVVQGRRVEEFETAFSDYLNLGHAVAVANGTVALDLALKAAGIKRGDEVVVPSFSFVSTANAVLFQGAKPVFADLEEEKSESERTFNLSPNDVLEKLTERTKAVVGVHLFGHPFDVRAIQEICEDHDLILIEDCAQAHGAEYEGKRVGGFGTAGCFSFYATKNMTTGEGGMVTTESDEVARLCRLLRNHGEGGGESGSRSRSGGKSGSKRGGEGGRSQKYRHTILGYNYRMTDIQAAIGVVQLKKLDEFNESRINNAAYLNSRIKLPGLLLPHRRSGVKHVYHQYAVTIEEQQQEEKGERGEGFPASRDEFVQYLRERGVGAAVHYPLPIYKQPLYQRLGYTDEKVQCPVAAALSKKIFSLPVHPGLSEQDLETVSETINNTNVL
ncbi:aminotransferase DegT [ANME-1 cluster archaeon ex4572_4]|nr:MAG: aminotransferase DegT [ANME-1 cluster archaeon ex4572_4]